MLPCTSGSADAGAGVKMNGALVIPARVETGGCAEASRYRLLDKYQVYARFVLLDTLYLDSNYYFDNPSSLDKEKVLSLLPIYNSKTLEQRVSIILG